MELNSLQQKSTEGAGRLDNQKRVEQERQEKFARIADIKKEISSLKTPAMDYASKLVSLCSDRGWESGTWCDKLYRSPLIKVGELEDGKGIYIGAKQVFVSTSSDIDGYPTDDRHAFNRWEYVGGVGEPTGREYKGSEAETDKIGHLGTTLAGENIRGLVLSTERVYPETGNYTDEAVALGALNDTRAQMESIDETLALLRAGLTNEEWNPRDGLTQRNAQLVAEKLV